MNEKTCNMLLEMAKVYTVEISHDGFSWYVGIEIEREWDYETMNFTSPDINKAVQKAYNYFTR